VVAACWFALLSDTTDQLQAERDREPVLKKDYVSKLGQAVNLGELRKQKLQVQEYVTQLEKQLPGKAEMDALLSDINQAGLGRGLQFELFRPGQVEIKDFYAELPIAIKVSGKYNDIGAFAADVANLSRIVTLHNLSISGRCRRGTPAATCRWKRLRAPIAIWTPPRSRRSRRPRPRRLPRPRERRNDGPHESRATVERFAVACCWPCWPAAAPGHEELQEWMEQQRREVKPNVSPLSPPKKFDPNPTLGAGRWSPSATRS
jgi:Tfp pilus assembly protein PilO